MRPLLPLLVVAQAGGILLADRGWVRSEPALFLALLEHLRTAGLLEADTPLLVGGDWNTPSHLDWTADTARVYRFRRALDLPVSRAVHREGFVDVFREVHPNAVMRPGITWSPMFRSRRDGKQQTFARIDRLYLKNPPAASGPWSLSPVDARVLPELWEDEAVPAGPVEGTACDGFDAHDGRRVGDQLAGLSKVDLRAEADGEVSAECRAGSRARSGQDEEESDRHE